MRAIRIPRTPPLRLASMVAGVCLGLVLAACQDGITGSRRAPAPARLHLRVALGAAPVATLVVEVDGPGIARPLVFNLDAGGGVASGTIEVPPGEDRELVLSAYDAHGYQTHRAARTRDVAEGASTDLSVSVATHTVTVTPASAELEPGETVQLGAVISDADGEPVDAADLIRWISLDPGRAAVDDGGLVDALAPGQAQVVALYGSLGGSAAVEIQEPEPAPWFEVNFESYGSTTDLLADCVAFTCVEDNGVENIQLDPTAAYVPGGLTRAMRFDYLHGGNGCTSISNTRQIPLPSRRQEVWAEFVVRWSENFRTTNDACVPNDHKLIFGHTGAGDTGRWAFYVGADTGPDHTLMVEHPGLPLFGAYYPNNSNHMVPTDLWDGEWHVIGLHLRHSTGNTGGDGALEVWVDGALIHSETNLNTPTDDGRQDLVRAFSLGRNKDDGPAGELMSLWWARVRIWDTDPGW